MIQGDIYLFRVPYSDGSGSKPRPVLIISGHHANKGQDVVVVPISSNTDRSDDFTILVEDTWDHFGDTGLDETSRINWSKPITVSKASLKSLKPRLGYLHAELLQEVKTKFNTLTS